MRHTAMPDTGLRAGTAAVNTALFRPGAPGPASCSALIASLWGQPREDLGLLAPLYKRGPTGTEKFFEEPKVA